MTDQRCFQHESKPWFMSTLGQDPFAEAAELEALCERAKADLRVVAEFASTLERYTGGIATVAAAIQERYSDPESRKVGAVIFDSQEPVGMAYFGVANYETTDGIEGSGINLGCWLLDGHRGYGLGAWAMQTLGVVVNKRRHDPTHPLYKAPQWTSIRIGNIPSENLLHSSSALVTAIGDDANNEGYRIYTLRRMES